MQQPRLGILGGLAALAVGIGVAAAGIGHLLQSMPSARAADGIGPAVTGGEHPWINLGGLLDAVDTSTVIYTVPPDRIFVMTGGCVDNTNAQLFEDGTLKVHDNVEILRCDNVSSSQDDSMNMLRAGQAHIVFEPGSQVIVTLPAAGTWPYYLEGYLAHP